MKIKSHKYTTLILTDINLKKLTDTQEILPQRSSSKLWSNHRLSKNQK